MNIMPEHQWHSDGEGLPVPEPPPPPPPPAPLRPLFRAQFSINVFYPIISGLEVENFNPPFVCRKFVPLSNQVK